MMLSQFTLLYCALSLAVTVIGQPQVQPEARNGVDCICKPTDTVCSCVFVIGYKLTMILEDEVPVKLVKPSNGILVMAGKENNNKPLTAEQTQKVITGDGETSRLVIAINGSFPGPRIETWENQKLVVTFVNTFHTDSVTVHFHGLHQRNTPWMDGVAFITQCPIQPGQTFVYRFDAYPPGTAMYHAHIGDQRSMGLYGPVIVRPKQNYVEEKEIIIALQDWNHFMDAETAYHRSITEQFDLETGEAIETTFSVDGGKFGKFHFHSGLVNGKGRYWRSKTSSNGSPLELFKVVPAEQYRFRIIGAMTLYPMRVFINGYRLLLRSSDAYNVDRIPVQSIIVHPGERYDFYWTAPTNSDSQHVLFVAETIETADSHAQHHAAEAVLELTVFSGPKPPPNPVFHRKETCTAISKCETFNCPYTRYPPAENRVCLTFNNVSNTDPNQEYGNILGNKVDEEYFFNFAFPGREGHTPGSVNGREFDPPTMSMLTQPGGIKTPCGQNCDDSICKCTHVQKLSSNKLVQLVFTNLGRGSGWSHPVHLHGHSFYVMKMGFGEYDTDTGRITKNNDDIVCTDRNNYCNTARWRDATWALGNIPDLNKRPPAKDTIVVPTGGYVVVRIRTDNPGMWFLHCHIDLHSTNGMGLVIDEGGVKPPAPAGFPTCGDFLYDITDRATTRRTTTVKNNGNDNNGNVGFASTVKGSTPLVVVAFIAWLMLKQ